MATKCNCYLQYLILRHNGYLTSTICPLFILWYSELGQCSGNQSELCKGLYSRDIIHQIFEFSNLSSDTILFINKFEIEMVIDDLRWQENVHIYPTSSLYSQDLQQFFAIRWIHSIIVTRHLLKGAYYHQSTVAKTSFVLKGSKKMF